ncbi:MAG: RluA family pseudouridine synthase [Candidatus Didemnitutus sp.]|nr:RluA family pseudouridine synthase [Candidatus Didemnitutus sp.]
MPHLPPIIFEDDALLAFDKPSDLPVAAERRAPSKANLLAAVRAKFGAGVANVHRLDTEASGLVLFTKSKVALDFISGQFQSKTVAKHYHALVVGAPELDFTTIELVLKEDEGAPGKMCVVKKHGQAAVTDVQVLERFGAFTLVDVQPRTGRTHQIRVHLAATGTPLLNDPLYGNGTPLLLSGLKRGYKGRDEERPLIDRLALHATALTFNHPLTRERTTLTAPLPKDLEVALKYLRKFSPGTKRHTP